VLTTTAGCLLDRTGAGVSPSNRDAAVPSDTGAALDADRPVDAFATDAVVSADVPCTTHCDGERVVSCDGALIDDCAARDAYCEESPAVACVPRICEPDTTRCEDGTVHRCNERGSLETAELCASGFCDGDACASDVCPYPDLPAIDGNDTMTFDPCDQPSAQAPVPGSCESATGNGPDTLVRLVVEEPSRVEIELRDDDDVPIDTVLAIRRICDLEASQIACSDDAPCMIGDPDECEGGYQPRRSTLTEDLEPGTYYLLLDTDLRDSFECGQVQLRVRFM
jgi:hypothetical protein